MNAEPDRTTKWDLISEIPSLTGKVAIVTGSNSPQGLGFHIAKNLALKGAKVYLSARSSQKCEDAIKLLKEQNPSLAEGDLLHPLALDIGNLQSIGPVVREFTSREKRLDILVNNAALLARPLDKDKNGISLSFATNHLGPYRLTTELLPLLEATAKQHPGVRIVNVTSVAHKWIPHGVKLGSLEDFNQTMDGPDSNLSRYGLSKLANILFTKRLQAHFDISGIPAISISVHPGGVKTDGAITYLGSEDHPMFEGTLTPEDGALTTIFAAAHPDPWSWKNKYGGSYLEPFGALVEPSQDAQDAQLAAGLWDASESVLKDIGA